MNLKIVEYNILNGFCTETIPYKLQKTRMQNAASLLSKENPDILVLTEAYLWPFALRINNSNFLSFFKEMYSFISEPTLQFRWAPVVLSKFQVSFEDHSTYRKAWLRTKMTIRNKKLLLDVVHPHPDLSEDERAAFMSTVIKDIKVPYVLAGDFNALSPQDTYDKKRLTEGYKTFMRSKADQKVNDLFTFTTIKEILAHDLKDTFHANLPKKPPYYTVPTDLRSKDKRCAVKMDYIFSSPDLKVIDTGIIKNEITERASDHYPVYAVLRIE